MRLVKMDVKGLVLDPVTNVPIIILRDEIEGRVLPIWIGLFEANAIALKLEEVESQRPMTHDLLKNLLQALGGTLERIEIVDLADNTYYANLSIVLDGRKIAMDSRPSDAIALALRAGVPIFVNEEVLEKATAVKMEDDFEDSDKLREWIDNLRPEDFGGRIQ